MGNRDIVVIRLSFPLWLYYGWVGFLNPAISFFLDLDNLHFVLILILLISPDKTSGKKQFLIMHFCGTKCRRFPNLNRVLKFCNVESGVHQKQSRCSLFCLLSCSRSLEKVYRESIGSTCLIIYASVVWDPTYVLLQAT